MRTSPNLGNHALYYARPENAYHFDFLLSGREVISSFQVLPAGLQRPQDALRTLLQRLDVHGYRIIFFDLTPPEVRNAGLTVIRAVTPDLVRQSIGLVARHLNHSRLLSTHVRLKLAAEVTTREGFFADEHPFP